MTWFSKVRNSDTLKRLTKHLHITLIWKCVLIMVDTTTIRKTTISQALQWYAKQLRGLKCLMMCYYWWTWRINSNDISKSDNTSIVFRRRNKSLTVIYGNCYKYKLKQRQQDDDIDCLWLTGQMGGSMTS